MVLRRSGLDYGPLITFDPRKTRNAFRVQARNKLGRYTNAQGSVLRANRRSLVYMQNRSAKNLDDAIAAHGRPQTFSSGRLRRAILSDEFSRADRDGFEFLIDSLIEPAVPYYRAIESGSRHMVNKRILIIGSRQRGAAGIRGIARDGDQRGVLVRNPIKAYNYGTDAFATFKKAGIYKRYVKAALAEDGLELE